MREILFRAKAINRDIGFHRTSYKNGDWVYGLITRLYDERFEILPAEMRDIDGINGIEIDYTTIGQYTGLTDKNGVKIFEGDIVKRFWLGMEIIYKITYESKHTCFIGKAINTSGFTTFDNDGKAFEIIGNIHDNSELLEGGAE